MKLLLLMFDILALSNLVKGLNDVVEEDDVVDGVNTEVQDAVQKKAESFTCPQFEKGDGTGGSEKKIGTQTGFACVEACIQRREINGIQVNGVTVRKDGKPGCWCEMNMKSVSESSRSISKYMTCFLEPKMIGLTNAKQSSTYDNGKKNARSPIYAIDNNPQTTSVTGDIHDGNPWWKAEFLRPVIVHSLYLMFTPHAVKKGYYKGLKVQIRGKPSEKWYDCAVNIEVKRTLKEVQCNRKAPAKYLKLSTAIGEPLYLAELMVLGFGIEAKIKMTNAKQSSTYDNGKKIARLASLAIDGNTRTVSVTSDNHDPQPWWKAELVHPALLREVKLILSPYAVKKGYYRGLMVQVRYSNEPWLSCANNLQVKATILTVECSRVTPVKFIKISTSIGAPLYLNEVKALGYEESAQ